MDNKKNIDIIILSYAQNDELKAVTVDCIRSLIKSDDPEEIKFNIIVIESQKQLKPFQYEGTTTIYPDTEFGYNRYMNIGIEMTSSPFICLCNNDLIFHAQWATNMLKAFELYDLPSGSPACSIHHPTVGFKLDGRIYYGYRTRHEIAGWCLFFKRDILRLTGKLDENFRFWAADDDYATILRILNLRHALVTSSIVDHVKSKTLENQTEERQEELTFGQVFYYEKKWNYRLGARWVPVTLV
ncbi:glycosyltransferase family 2 protein [Pedobacter hartonius]|uniref:Glycosyltransferase, GT2 family n=1 Tax=Pedobacter hartonius TaxID=425514 RepID=A0A1H4HDL1_9SPHI|nr:glycosyltransferase [Pedobacter hartonius]SEB19863.1 Glycosyltransferase, GT2 family [Pedobacter hartonius]